MLQKGDKAPQFKGVDQNGKEINSSDYAGKKYVLFFIRKQVRPVVPIKRVI